ncbi:hypothetical protein NIES4073_19080 [Kalymmatonema gypsitolerans NIES-4073]|nr:hypothetical protein NIES4073_19080 [Scytonema sp. NIES-4073]
MLKFCKERMEVSIEASFEYLEKQAKFCLISFMTPPIRENTY